MAAKKSLSDGDRIVTIVILSEEDLRFHSAPLSLIDNYFGVDGGQLVWDNYEFAHYLFPVRTENLADREFILTLMGNKVYNPNEPESDFAPKLSRLENCLAANHEKITTLLIWGDNPRVVNMLNKWFVADPGASSGAVRVLRHR